MFATYNSLRKKDAFISVIELPRIPAYHPKIRCYLILAQTICFFKAKMRFDRIIS